MVNADDVKKLADLSRLSLSEKEVEKLRGEIDSIIAYIDTVQKVPIPEIASNSLHLDLENVMREDENPHESGIHTETLLKQAPRREGNYLKVKKILG